MFADIILPLNLPQLLTYGVPVEMQDFVRPGMRVEVALGKNKQYSGVVARLHNNKPDSYAVKPIKAIIDETPVVTEIQLRFWSWIGDYYMAAPGEVMNAALPAHLKLMSETRLVWLAENMHPDIRLTNFAGNIADTLSVKKEITVSELKSLAGEKNFTHVLNELLELELIAINDSLEPAYKARKEKFVSIHDDYHEEGALIQLFDRLAKSPKQLELLMAYSELRVKAGHVKQAELLERAKATYAQLKALIDKGVFYIEQKETDRLPGFLNEEEKHIVFTEEQAKAYDELDKCLTEKPVTLFHGVTGSGKTLLYVQKIKEAIACGKQALLLLPEIALTTQLVGRLLAYFGDDLGVYHSNFSNNERVEIWEKVRKGKYKVVVGARSALWLPYSSLGIIIVDEEHDPSFKQKEPAPRFHARDGAIYLASLFNSRVILGSATPSVESLYNVRQGKYAYVSLKERYLGVDMPTIELVDARSIEKASNGTAQVLTPQLQGAINEALKQKKQVIIFQNRRGYAPFMMCVHCGWIPQCKNCAVSLTYHKSTDKLQCHYCGLKSAVVHQCPSCGSNGLISKTFGTEKVEEEMRQTFPQARVARMDVDSMRGKNKMSELFDNLNRNRIDILVGTQMVVKGLDFSSVSLVGILNADSLLGFPDFRVNERGFQLMEQVSGRAGRADGKGKVMIQAFNLMHPALQWVREHDLNAFYKHEIKFREQFGYPPFSRLLKIIIKHKDEDKAIDAASLMGEHLHKIPGITVQGPGPALIPRIREQYIQEIYIKMPKHGTTVQHVKKFLREEREFILAIKGNSAVQIIFDVDPM